MGRRASNPEQRVILTKAKAAGWRVVDTSSGWRVCAPDGVGMVTMHSSSSDRRALAAIKSDFKRAGLNLDAMTNGNGKPQPTLENEAMGSVPVHGTEPPTEYVPQAVPDVGGRDVSTTVVAPERFIPPQPLVTNGKAHSTRQKMPSVRIAPPEPELTADDGIRWEDPPKMKRGRKSGNKAMDRCRVAMLNNPGRWLVFQEKVSAGMAGYYRRQYGKLGFEFIGHRDPENHKLHTVYARYVGTEEAS